MDFKKYLTEEVLPFWLRNAQDTQEGGIFTQLDRSGNVYGEEKSVWFQGRSLWTFAKAYNLIEAKEEYLEACRNIYRFLPKCGDENLRMAFTVTRDGEPIQKRRYYFSETFAAIGCAEYYKACRVEEVRDKAEQYFDVAYRLFKNPSLTKPKYETSGKALSPVMIMLATAQVMRSLGVHEEKYHAIVTEMAEEVLHGGYLCEEAGALLENVSATGEFVNTPAGRVVNPGHSLEAAWFLMSEGVYQNNREYIATAQKIIDITMPKGIDKEYGGVIAFRDALGFPPTALEWDMKLWWPQCEGMIANLLAYQVLGEQKYLDNYQSLSEYAFENFADKECGEWYGYLHYDNTPANDLKGNIFKGPFHLPRMLMILHGLTQGDSILNFMK